MKWKLTGLKKIKYISKTKYYIKRNRNKGRNKYLFDYGKLFNEIDKSYFERLISGLPKDSEVRKSILKDLGVRVLVAPP